MKKITALSVGILLISAAYAQPDARTSKELVTRAGDHFMVQVAHNIWQGAPDSLTADLSGLNRSANAYFMLNKPFKSNPKFSIGIGVGMGTANMYFKDRTFDLDANLPLLPNRSAETLVHYKKYKMTTAFAEAPLELRFSSQPSTPNKSVKAALGVKVGTLLAAYTKGKNRVDGSGKSLSSAIEKVKSKSYFQSTRVSATARVGYGLISLFGTYSLTPLFKDGTAPDIKPMQIGLTISGL